MSFNYEGADGHLASQHYTSCVRKESGYRCVEYTACSDPDSFELNPGFAEAGSADRDVDCPIQDFIEIEASSAVCGAVGAYGINGEVTSRYCGQRLSSSPGATANNPICDCTAPFAVRFEFDAFSDFDIEDDSENTLPSRGACLNYRQIP